MRGLKGQVALVTGAAQGIGRAIAHRLAEEGARVAVADLNEAGARAVAGEIGEQAIAVGVDVTDFDTIQVAVRTVSAALGPIDVLVNNVGWDRMQPFVQTTEEFWDHVIAVNLKGVIACCRAVLDGMIERRHGKIVSISSGAGLEGSKGEAVYSAAKAGVIGFSKALAREVGPYGINVNVVAPGPTRTPLFEKVVATNAKLLAAVVKAGAFKRPGEPEEIAAAVAFLASDDARFMTGDTLSVSGGLTMH